MTSHFSIHRVTNDSNYFRNAKEGDIVLGFTDSNKRIIIGTSNNMSTLDIGSNTATVNGNMLATHVATNTMNSSILSLYLPSDAGSNYMNYTMPGSIQDAIWTSNLIGSKKFFDLSNSNQILVNAHTSFNSNVTINGSLTAEILNYVTSNVNVYNSQEFYSNLTVEGRLLANSNIGIGINAPVYPLHVNKNTNGVSIFASADITAFSDSRVKSDLSNIDGALDKVRAISGYTFSRNHGVSTSNRHCGLIAQELKEVLPEAVFTDPASGLLSVAYGNTVSLLVNAIKELEIKVDELKDRVDKL